MPDYLHRRPRTAPPGIIRHEDPVGFQPPAIFEISVKDRLVRPNTATARKFVLWSSPRRQYEDRYESQAIIKDKTRVWENYPKIAYHYPGTWKVARKHEMEGIIERVNRPTVCSRNRTEESVTYRQGIEKRAARRAYYQNYLEAKERERWNKRSSMKKYNVYKNDDNVEAFPKLKN